MNNSKPLWGQNSPGFVYYDNSNNKSNTSESLDYIEFSNTGSPQSQFEPGNYSSPTNNFKHRNYSFNRSRGGRGYNRRFNNSRHQNSRDSTNTSTNNSFSPYNNSRQYKPYDRPKYDKNDINQYYDSSMVEDPWAELEKDLESTSQSDSDQEKNSSTAFKRFDVDIPTSKCDESTDSQDDSQISAESS